MHDPREPTRNKREKCRLSVNILFVDEHHCAAEHSANSSTNEKKRLQDWPHIQPRFPNDSDSNALPSFVGPVLCSSAVECACLTESSYKPQHSHRSRNAARHRCKCESVYDAHETRSLSEGRFLSSRVNRSALRVHVDSAIEKAIETARINSMIFNEECRRRKILFDLGRFGFPRKGPIRKEMDWLDINSHLAYSDVLDIYIQEAENLGLREYFKQLPPTMLHALMCPQG